MDTFAKEVSETKSLLSEQKRESEVTKTYMRLAKWVFFFYCVKQEK